MDIKSIFERNKYKMGHPKRSAEVDRSFLNISLEILKFI